MTGQELHNLIDKNLTQQGARDRITGLELREVEHALATEVGNLQNTSVIGLIYKDPVQSISNLSTTYPNPQKGWAAIVKDTGYIYQWDGTKWGNTGLKSFPEDVAIKGGYPGTLKELKNELDTIVDKTFAGGQIEYSHGNEYATTNTVPIILNTPLFNNLFTKESGIIKKIIYKSPKAQDLIFVLLTYNPATNTYIVKKTFTQTLTAGLNTIDVNLDCEKGDTIGYIPKGDNTTGWTDDSTDQGRYYYNTQANPVRKMKGFLPLSFVAEYVSYTVDSIKDTLNNLESQEFAKKNREFSLCHRIRLKRNNREKFNRL
jgi:hypothetical protein